jgi:hypothetical protein
VIGDGSCFCLQVLQRALGLICSLRKILRVCLSTGRPREVAGKVFRLRSWFCRRAPIFPSVRARCATNCSRLAEPTCLHGLG